MKRFQRPIIAAMAATLTSAGLAVVAAPAANAAVLGSLSVTPESGTDSTLFGGSLTAACPSGTTDAFFDIVGNDIGVGAPAGSQETGFLGASTNSTGTGPQSFSGASIANLKTTNAGSFATSGPYQIRFVCFDSAGVATDTYERQMNYTAGGAGAYTIAAAPVANRATATSLTATPATVEQGDTVTLTADVTPTTGADDPVGSVEFFRGTTSLGVDNTLTADGVGTLAVNNLPVGSNSITAVYTPASGAPFTGSTSPAQTVQVTPVADVNTTSVLSVTPVSGPAYAAVTLTCDVDPVSSTRQPNGTARFLDGTATVGEAPVTGGAPASITSSSFAPGAHSFVCQFIGTPPFQNSTSNTVTATYEDGGAAVPDPQTVTVNIPAGALTITTPYTPEAPLALGTALLDQSDATYSASARFGDGPGRYITISDTRAGNRGWNASVIAGPFQNGTSSFPGKHAGLTELVKLAKPNNALVLASVTLTPTTPNAPGLGTTTEFARYPSGQSIGSVDIYGTFGIDGVPTSVVPGTYTSTVTFTAV